MNEISKINMWMAIPIPFAVMYLLYPCIFTYTMTIVALSISGCQLLSIDKK